MFLRNCWYVAAWAHELDDGLLARTILGGPLVLFRLPDGSVAALEDRCCHRHLPLSKGRLLGDIVQCGYHGLEFDRTGSCVRVPGQARVPPGSRVRSYPLVERWRWLWVWMGDPARADPALIPDYHWNDDPGWTSYGDIYYVRGDYRLLVDNLIDLSHIQFLHATTLGASTDANADVKIARSADHLTVSRWVLDTPPAPMYAHALQTNANVDRWQNIKYTPASSVVIDAGSAIAGTGAPRGDRSRGVETYSNHFLTPETAKTTHYFWHHARNFRRGDNGFTADLRRMFSSALKEDVVAIEAQQRSIDLVGGRPTVDLNCDAGGLQARRMLDERIAADTGRWADRAAKTAVSGALDRVAAASLPASARGAAWMVTAAAGYAVTGAIVRELSHALPVFELAFLRAVLTLLLLVPFMVRAGRAGLATQQLRIHGLRSVMTYAGIVFWFFGVSAIPLGDYYALYFTMPLFTIAGAALALGERVPAASWAAVAVGFAGALVIVRPGFIEVSLGAVCAIASALTYAGSNVVTRVLSRRDSPAVIVIYSNLLVLLIGAIPAAFVWRTPTWEELPLVVALGVASTFAQYCYTRAIATADARVVQPFDFCRLPIAAALGLLLFGEASEVWTWVGAVIIFAAGSYVLRRERKAPA